MRAELGECGGVDAGVLADVEGLEVQAVGADFEQEGVDQERGEAVPRFWSRVSRRMVRSARSSEARA